MIRVALRRGSDGALKEVESTGHASTAAGSPGENVACAAVSALLRSSGRLLASRPGIEVDGDASEPGRFRLVLRRVRRGQRRYLQGVTDVLVQGLSDIYRDFPDEIEIQDITEGDGKHGT